MYLQMTRTLASLEQTVDSTELDWNLLYERQQNCNRWNKWSGAWRTNQGRDTYESVDGDGGTAQDAHSWSDREGRWDEVKMQETEARVNIPSHGQSTEDFLPDVIRGWLVLQKSDSQGPATRPCWEVLRTRWVDRGFWKLSNNGGQVMSFWHTMEIASETATERCAPTSNQRQMSGNRRCI